MIYYKTERSNTIKKLKIFNIVILVIGFFIIIGCGKGNLNNVQYSTGINVDTGETLADIVFSIKRSNKNIDQFENELVSKLGEAEKFYSFGSNYTDLNDLRTYEQVKKGIDRGYTLPIVYVIKSNSEIYFMKRFRGVLGTEPAINIYAYRIKLKSQNSFDDPKGILKSKRGLIQSIVSKYFK